MDFKHREPFIRELNSWNPVPYVRDGHYLANSWPTEWDELEKAVDSIYNAILGFFDEMVPINHGWDEIADYVDVVTFIQDVKTHCHTDYIWDRLRDGDGSIITSEFQKYWGELDDMIIQFFADSVTWVV